MLSPPSKVITGLSPSISPTKLAAAPIRPGPLGKLQDIHGKIELPVAQEVLDKVHQFRRGGTLIPTAAASTSG